MSLTRRQFLRAGAITCASAAALAAVGAADPASASERGSALKSLSDASPVEEGTYGVLVSSMAVMSDTHVDDDAPDYDSNFENALDDVVQRWNPVDSIVLNGDLTNNGYQYQYDILEQRAQAAGFSFPASFTCVMGNHEQMGDGTHTQELVESLHANFLERTNAGSIYFDRYVGGSHVIALGPDEYVSPNDVTSTDTFRLSSTQLSWISGLLDEDQSAGVPSFVFVHEPLTYTVTDSYPGGWGYENSLENDADLRSVIFSHPGAILFSGHTHSYPDVAQRGGGNLFVGTGSVAYAYAQGETYLTDDGSYDSLGWLVRHHEQAVEFCMRDFLAHEWVAGSHYVCHL
ncbi:MAG: metallophosphoesterase [Olsenella sp.]|jgi:predicted phosphodiesterase|nr:metallophosphoesterase [Olsenella sp.]MCI1646180.1 metallophosphoesterase [Olsenella sp.]MCI1793780.1 metallophosphoesterase [Olsenella sp.]MCI1811618.1 metallophosphoesterase [Olsenella sp.]MCI1879251.1 metallophosphoesterase [Olsenella sp.]